MDLQLLTAQKECCLPGDSATMSEEAKKMHVCQFNLDFADGIPGKGEITRTTSSKGGADIQSHSPVTDLPNYSSLDSADGIPHANEVSITNSSNGHVIHSPNYARGIPKNEDTTLMLVGANKNPTDEDPRFIVDSGATVHATGIRNFISEWTNYEPKISVKMANGNLLRSHGCGHVITEDYTLPNVHYVPGLHMNIVSVSKLGELGYDLTIMGNKVCIIDHRTNNLVGKASNKGGVSGLFELDFLRVRLD